MRIYEYIKIAGEKPFIGSATAPACVITEDFQKMLTEFIGTCYYYNILMKKITYEKLSNDEIVQHVKNVCDMIYKSHAYEYQTLYDTTIAEYNPIENYNMNEHEVIKNSGTDKTTMSKGEQKTTDEMGQAVVTNLKGKEHSKQHSSGDTAPFETQTYKKVDQTDTEYNSDSRTDTATAEPVTNSHTRNSYSDTDSLEHGHEVERDLTRSGNIGVTTTQQMLESQRDLARFNLVRIVANDLMQTLTLCISGGGYSDEC